MFFFTYLTHSMKKESQRVLKYMWINSFTNFIIKFATLLPFFISYRSFNHIDFIMTDMKLYGIQNEKV